LFPFEYIFFFHTDHTPFFSNSTSIAKFERAFSNHFAFLHQNRNDTLTCRKELGKDGEGCETR
ncbi:hypothetical protein, partial [Bacillus cereus]|uniref:hypothetical protein n=1 Tax=Bacillus cereus TaxID=1396 RepID=UPI001C379A9B